MNRKFDVGCCACTDPTTCCDTKTATCTTSGEPTSRCCCFCASAPPCEYDVTISGVTDFSSNIAGNVFKECTGTSIFNDTFTLQRYASSNSDDQTDGYCVWWSFFDCELPSNAAKCVLENGFNSPDTIAFAAPQVMVLELWYRKFTLRIFTSGWYVDATQTTSDRNWCDVFYGGNNPENNTNLMFGILHKPASYRSQYQFEYEPSGSGEIDCDLSSATFTKVNPFIGDEVSGWPNYWEFGDWSSATVEVSAG